MATAPIGFANALDCRIYQNPAKPIKFKFVCAFEEQLPNED
jgi:hypothetical protein